MNDEKLRKTLLEFISNKQYIPTYEYEPLTDQIIGLIKDQEPKVPEPTEVI